MNLFWLIVCLLLAALGGRAIVEVLTFGPHALEWMVGVFCACFVTLFALLTF